MVKWSEILMDYILFESALNEEAYKKLQFQTMLNGDLVMTEIDKNSIVANRVFVLSEKDCERIFKLNYYGKSNTRWLDALNQAYDSDLSHK